MHKASLRVPVCVCVCVCVCMCVLQYRNQILYLVESYRTVVIVGETGSGKTTQVRGRGHTRSHCQDTVQWLP